ncbi:MAG TPA: BTAD domain-containing putative transcriptional regulator, partial [Kiloniellaceae bacterium]|nr:BTAD domain-containing putative transcriptional regulator [Kiloniellaceae bacterium]
MSADSVTVDALEFERACRSATIADLRRVKDLYRGRFLAGFPSDSAEFEDWQRSEAMRLEAITKLLEIDPLNETGVCLQLRALSTLGRRAEAIRRYQGFTERLAAELDCDPAPETEAVFRHVKTGAHFLGDAKLTQPERPSVVVIPLRRDSSDKETNLRADALSEAITSELSRDRSLFVIACNTAAAYKEQRLTAAEVASDLGVRYLVEGSYAASPERLRLSVQLIDGKLGAHVWTTAFNRPYKDFLEVQDEVVSEIVATLRGYKGVLQRAELDRSRSKSDIELTTYELLMRGMAYKETFRREDMLIARDYFQQAIARSPGFAMAHGWLAWTWFFDVYMGWVEDPTPSLKETLAAAREAVRLDAGLDFAHWALGAAYLAAGDLRSSLSSFKRALELNPNNSDALANSAWPLMFDGDFDRAEESLEKAVRLNPYHPEWYLWGIGMLA